MIKTLKKTSRRRYGMSRRHDTDEQWTPIDFRGV